MLETIFFTQQSLKISLKQCSNSNSLNLDPFILVFKIEKRWNYLYSLSRFLEHGLKFH